ncbi:uncharacterized protein [Maniola hyperantus]|uniref:uncharacterized protein isoform X7 n=1 Tax=Aphantopus hyperantus TaxID=2795564 RepID=UPI0037494449
MVYCTVCVNNNRKNKNTSFFSYPKDSTRRHEWLKAVGREDLLTKLVDDKKRLQYRICEEHFNKSCIKYSKNGTVKYLFDNAFPTLNLPTNDGACSSSSSSPCDKSTPIPVELLRIIYTRKQVMPTAEIDQTSCSIQTDTCKESCENKSSQTALHLSTDSPRKRKLALEHREARKRKTYQFWINACQRPDLRNKNIEELYNTHVCGLHFAEWMYMKQKLKSAAVPILNLPSQAARPKLVFNQAVGDEQPSTSAGEELQYQASRYSMLSGNDGNQSALEEIIIKEEITDEERYQCRLCLSVGRKMQELGEYAPLYRKLLFENNYQNTTIPSFMYQMLACWECHAELRKVKRFQDKVRRANNAFETSQNQKCENLSNLSTILIGEYKNSQPGGTDQPSSVEDCAQGIKEEAVEVEVEETALPDPLEVSQVKPSDQEFDINLEIQKETNPSVSTEKVAKRTIPEQTPNILKRAKLDQTVPKPGPKRAKLDQSGQKPAQEEESEPKSTPESDADAIFGKVKIEIDELQKILQERRNKESFKSMKFKCDSCVLGFTDHNRLLEHNKNFHDEEVGTCECDICERRFDDEDQLSAHHRNHFVKFVCKLCNFECYTKTGRAIHFKRHKGALQGTSLEDLLKKKLTSNQRASASGSSHKTST